MLHMPAPLLQNSHQFSEVLLMKREKLFFVGLVGGLESGEEPSMGGKDLNRPNQYEL